jgi:two-component system, sensor histidine kinase SagS
MPKETAVRKLLVLQGPVLQAEGILEFLRQHYDVNVISSMEDALESLRGNQYDAVLAETADFLPLERGVVTQQAAAVLDTIGEGVCIVGPRGDLVWANRRLREFAGDVLDPIREICARAYHEMAHASGAGAHDARRFSLMPDDQTYYEVICSPVHDSLGGLRQVAAVVVNATSQRRQQLKLNAIDRAGRELVRIDYQSISHRDAAQRLVLLEERIIRYSREVLQYQHFEVMLLDKRNNRLEPLLAEGLDRTAEKQELFARTEGNGICGYVAATGRSYVCPDVTKDDRYLPGLPGAGSTLTVPLRLHDAVVGVLNVESDRAGAFAEEDRQFAEIFANYVALALHILNLLVFERHTTHTQIEGSIAAEFSGPVNDIVTEASELMEDYIGHDDLRKRIASIIDQAVLVRDAIQRLSRGTATGPIPREPAQPDPILCGKRVLVADDEESIRQTVQDVLAPFGMIVELACDGAVAKEMIQRSSYDLVISDIKMPGASGYEVFAQAKACSPQTKVILITGFGYDPNHSIVRANQEGLSAVIFKPFKVKQLLEECRSALAKA